MPLDLIGIPEESTVRIEPERRTSSEELFDFCQANSLWRIERMADGEIEIMPLAGMESSHRCVDIGAQLYSWTKQDGRGKAFGSSAGFELVNSAMLSPDASWIATTRLAILTREQKKVFAPICPTSSWRSSRRPTRYPA
jgi:Uma2 family endonuclease